jgi:DNA mismatch endonuclease, patch repair protein
VHGCFWHRHANCPAARLPKSRLDFWEPKLAGNVERDASKRAELQALGWQVLVIWECETRKAGVLAALAQRILSTPRANRAR